MKTAKNISFLLLSIFITLSISCNSLGVASDIVGSYSLTKNGKPDFEISNNGGGVYKLKLGGEEPYNLSTPSEADCKERIGMDYKNIIIDSYYSPKGIYFFKVKKGSIIHGEVNESGYYFLTYIAGQAWKVK